MTAAKRVRRRVTAEAPKRKRSPVEVLLAEILREPLASVGFCYGVRDHYASAADQHERAAQAHRVAGVAELAAAALSSVHRAAMRGAVKK